MDLVLLKVLEINFNTSFSLGTIKFIFLQLGNFLPQQHCSNVNLFHG
jgi:hypothetical protein